MAEKTNNTIEELREAVRLIRESHQLIEHPGPLWARIMTLIEFAEERLQPAESSIGAVVSHDPGELPHNRSPRKDPGNIVPAPPSSGMERAKQLRIANLLELRRQLHDFSYWNQQDLGQLEKAITDELGLS